MFFTLFIVLSYSSINQNNEVQRALENQDLCSKEISSNSSPCIISKITTNANLKINSANGITLFALFQDINDDQEINISNFDVNGQVYLTSNRRLHININGNLNINGNVVFNNFFLSVSTLNLNEKSNFIVDTITVDIINFDCDNNFVCSSIKAQNFYSIDNQVTIKFNEPFNSKNINRISTILTILDGQSPEFNFNSLNSTSNIVIYKTDPVSTSSQSSSGNDLQRSFNLTAKYLGCRIPNHIVGQTCVPCPENQASRVDGSSECYPCRDGEEYSNEKKSCVQCSPGTYYDKNTKTCKLCQLGTYQPNSMQLECIKCPVNSTTINMGSESIYSCVCPAGYYGRSGEGCGQCYESEICEFGSLFPRADVGHWMDENHFYYASVCQPRYACFGNSTCNEGYEGKFCGSCSKGYFRLHQGCVKCHKSVPPIIAILMIFLVVLLFYFSVYNPDYFPMFAIIVHFFQEISMFSFLNMASRASSFKFFSYLSFFYFNPQIFQPQCYGLHNWSPSIQIAMAIPIIVSLILFICSLLSWGIPSIIKFRKREDHSFKAWRKVRCFKYTFWDCLNVFKESVAASFYVFFPAYFGLVMRTIKYSQITLASSTNYLDLQPSTIFNDPASRPSIITAIIIILILIAFVSCLDTKVILHQLKIKKNKDKNKDNDNKNDNNENNNNNTNKNEENSDDANIETVSYKIIISRKQNPIVSMKGHCYTKMFTNPYWVGIIHVKFLLIYVSWIYLQRYLIFQYGLSLAIYTIYLSLLLAFQPYSTFSLLSFYSEFLKYFNIIVASAQINKGSPKFVNIALIVTTILFVLYCLLEIIFRILDYYLTNSNTKNVESEKSKKDNEDDFRNLVETGNDSDQYIEQFIEGGYDSILKIMTIKNQKLKEKFLKIYFEFNNYAKDSRQDFRSYDGFIKHKFRPFALKIISKFILCCPTIYCVYLDRIANEWSSISNSIKRQSDPI